MPSRRALPGAAALLAVTVAAGGPARAADPVTVERIAAVVDNEIILYSEVRERATLMGMPAIDDNLPPAERRKADQALRQVLDRMVDDQLVLAQATQLKITVEAAEIDRAVDEIRKQNNLDEAQFLEALQGQGYTLASYRKDMRKQLLRLKVINTAVRAHINVSEEDVRAFYDQTARKAGGKRSARVRHILVGVGATADATTVEQKKRVALRVIEEARGGRDFAELAKTYSDDETTKAEGGDLGWLEDGDLAPALSDVIFAMKPDEVRGPIRTDKGFEVVQLVEKKDSGVKTFDEVKDQLRQQLYQQQLEKQTNTWLGELRKKSHVDVRL